MCDKLLGFDNDHFLQPSLCNWIKALFCFSRVQPKYQKIWEYNETQKREVSQIKNIATKMKKESAKISQQKYLLELILH